MTKPAPEHLPAIRIPGHFVVKILDTSYRQSPDFKKHYVVDFEVTQTSSSEIGVGSVYQWILSEGPLAVRQYDQFVQACFGEESIENKFESDLQGKRVCLETVPRRVRFHHYGDQYLLFTIHQWTAHPQLRIVGADR